MSLYLEPVIKYEEKAILTNLYTLIEARHLKPNKLHHACPQEKSQQKKKKTIKECVFSQGQRDSDSASAPISAEELKEMVHVSSCYHLNRKLII